MTDTLDGETKESNKCLLKNQVIFLKNIDSQNRSTADVRILISCYAFAQHLLCRRRTIDVQQHSNHIPNWGKYLRWLLKVLAMANASIFVF